MEINHATIITNFEKNTLYERSTVQKGIDLPIEDFDHIIEDFSICRVQNVL